MNISEETIYSIISDFYENAFQDVIIGHFFMGKDHAKLIRNQFEFSKALLGKKAKYSGLPIPTAHKPFFIGETHYRRRQILLRESMSKFGVVKSQQDAWLEKEDSLKHLIFKTAGNPCNS